MRCVAETFSVFPDPPPRSAFLPHERQRRHALFVARKYGRKKVGGVLQALRKRLLEYGGVWYKTSRFSIEKSNTHQGLARRTP